MSEPCIFFTSDEHHGHRNIITYSKRPFFDVSHMTEELVRRHNAVVGPNDIVYHLGDFTMDERKAEGVLRRLVGRHRLVAGNHDRCHPCHRSWRAAERRYLGYGFESVEHTIQFEDFLVTHMPYLDDRGDRPKYDQYRPENKGQWLLHGHIHTLWKVKGRQINVGVDVWDYAPVPLETLLAIRAAG